LIIGVRPRLGDLFVIRCRVLAHRDICCGCAKAVRSKADIADDL